MFQIGLDRLPTRQHCREICIEIKEQIDQKVRAGEHSNTCILFWVKDHGIVYPFENKDYPAWRIYAEKIEPYMATAESKDAVEDWNKLVKNAVAKLRKTWMAMFGDELVPKDTFCGWVFTW